MIALSLMFLGGYGGMVSLVQMSVAALAGYMVAILGTSGQALTGSSILNAGSLVFLLAVFVAGFGLAYFVRKEWL